MALALAIPGALGLFRPPSAAGAELPRVVLLPVEGLEGVPERSVDRFTTLLLDELKTRDADFQVIPPPHFGEATAASASAQEVEQAQALGRRKLAALKFAAAIPAFNRAIELSLADPANADFDIVLSSFVSVAEARFRLNQRKRAQAALAEVVRLDPTYQLPPYRYPPVFSQALEQARTEGAAQPHGELEVDGPPGWSVFLDGHPLGRLPTSAPGVRLGRHSLRAEGPHGERLGQQVELTGESAQVHFEVAGATAAPEIATLIDAETASRLDAWCQAQGADDALLAVMYRNEAGLTVGAALYSARARGFTAFPPFHLDDALATANVEAFKLAERISGAVASFPAPAPLPLDLTGQTAKRGGEPSRAAGARTRKPVEGPAPWLTPSEKVAAVPSAALTPVGPTPGSTAGRSVKAGVPWWVWVAAGAGAAAVAGGTWYGISQSNRRVTGTVTATW